MVTLDHPLIYVYFIVTLRDLVKLDLSLIVLYLYVYTIQWKLYHIYALGWSPFYLHSCSLSWVFYSCEYSHCHCVPIWIGITALRLGLFKSFTILVSLGIFFQPRILLQALSKWFKQFIGVSTQPIHVSKTLARKNSFLFVLPFKVFFSFPQFISLNFCDGGS